MFLMPDENNSREICVCECASAKQSCPGHICVEVGLLESRQFASHRQYTIFTFCTLKRNWWGWGGGWGVLEENLIHANEKYNVIAGLSES